MGTLLLYCPLKWVCAPPADCCWLTHRVVNNWKSSDHRDHFVPVDNLEICWPTRIVSYVKPTPDLLVGKPLTSNSSHRLVVYLGISLSDHFFVQPRSIAGPTLVYVHVAIMSEKLKQFLFPVKISFYPVKITVDLSSLDDRILPTFRKLLNIFTLCDEFRANIGHTKTMSWFCLLSMF